MTERKLEERPIETLIPYARNARTHDDAGVAAIAASIKEFGFTNPVLIDGANGIIAGHGRVLAARKLGMPTVPCIELAHLSDTQRRAYILADNKLALNAGWDAAMLGLELQDLQAKDFDVSLAGFGAEELAELLADQTEGLTDPDEVPEAPAEPVSVLGDVWVLGKHRVMCGDSTSIDAVERLMAGERADALLTDPPYGMHLDTSFSFSKGNAEKHIKATKGYAPVIGDNQAFDVSPLLALLPSLREVFLFGADYYVDTLPNYGKAGAWMVWDKKNEALREVLGLADFELIWSMQRHKRRVYQILWNGALGTESEDTKRRVHPTQKPIKLLSAIIDDYIKPDMLVVDAYLGGGAALIACEKTARTCYGMELSPAYVDVAITRWQNFTGKAATLEADGRTFDEIAARGRTPH